MTRGILTKRETAPNKGVETALLGEYDAGLTSGQMKRKRKTGLKAASCELHNPRILNFLPGHTTTSVFLELASKK